MDREYYSIPEAAALLGVSRIAVFKKVKRGQLAALRFGRNWAVPSAALAAVLAAPDKASAAAPPGQVLARRLKKTGAGAAPPPEPAQNAGSIDTELL